ncbi:MAG: PHP domain-containing protein [Eubacteriales bacterium]
MHFHEQIYDLDELARFNLHIHTAFSNCAKPEMKLPDIIAAAEAAGLKAFALTDHFNDDNSNEECLERNLYLRKEAAEIGTQIKILFGAELSAYAPGKSLESAEVRAELDYKLYSCNHYHLNFWGQPEDKTARGYVEYSIAIISSLIISGKADCIAHPLIGRFVRAFDDKTLLTREITDNELGGLLELSKTAEVAWEINVGAILGDPLFGRRLWNLGREAGVVFNYGTDSHTLAGIDTTILLPEVKIALS